MKSFADRLSYYQIVNSSSPRCSREFCSRYLMETMQNPASQLSQKSLRTAVLMPIRKLHAKKSQVGIHTPPALRGALEHVIK